MKIRYNQIIFIAFLICFIPFHSFGQNDNNENSFDTARVGGNNEMIYSVFDEKPEPKDGMAGFHKFLSENLKYPKEARDNKAQGTVIISMIVEKSGRLTDVKVYKDPVGFACGEEAKRVIKMMPPWTPGKIKGKKVRGSFKIPVKFALRQG